MATRVESAAHVPSLVSRFNPLAQRMLGIGIPMGPNALITVRGRKSGVERTTPVAAIEIGGRRWVVGTFGEVNWVRNLRGAGKATLKVGRRVETVRAVALSPESGAEFFRDVLGPYVRKLPLGLGRWVLGTVLGAKDILEDPVGASERHPVFELYSA